MASKKVTKKSKDKSKKAPWTLQRVFPYLLVIFATIGLLASFDLTVEKFSLLKDPDYIPTCNISPILSCGSVMKTDTAEAFGFANSLVGLIGFAVVITIGMGVLAGATYRRWFWIGLTVGNGFWCRFCALAVLQQRFQNWRALPILHGCLGGHDSPLLVHTGLQPPRRAYSNSEKLKGVVAFIQRHHVDIIVVWFLILIGIILNIFWYYWSTLI